MNLKFKARFPWLSAWAQKRKEELLEKGWVEWASPHELSRAARGSQYPRETGQAHKRQTMYTYTDGPMMYLGQHIVKAMQDAGYPAKIVQCYRSPQQQDMFFADGATKARAYESPHQYSEAVDIIHPSKGWGVTEEYWETLATCVRIVGEKFDVELEHGHKWGWDSAHIELKDWRKVRERMRERFLEAERNGDDGKPWLDPRLPTKSDLWARFHEVLPNVAKQHLKSVKAATQSNTAKLPEDI